MTTQNEKMIKELTDLKDEMLEKAKLAHEGAKSRDMRISDATRAYYRGVDDIATRMQYVLSRLLGEDEKKEDVPNTHELKLSGITRAVVIIQILDLGKEEIAKVLSRAYRMSTSSDVMIKGFADSVVGVLNHLVSLLEDDYSRFTLNLDEVTNEKVAKPKG